MNELGAWTTFRRQGKILKPLTLLAEPFARSPSKQTKTHGFRYFSESFDATVFVGENVALPVLSQLQSVEEIDFDKIYPFSFSHHGKLPGEAEITIKVASEFKGKTVYIYYLNDNGKPVSAGKGVVAEDDTLTFTTDHCSVWFLSEESIASNNSLPIILILVGALVLLAAAVVAVVFIKRKKKQL